VRDAAHGQGMGRPGRDLRIRKSVQPAAARPGDVITYTLIYSNAGAYPPRG